MGRGFDEEIGDNELLYLLGLRERMLRLFDEHSPAREIEGLGTQVGWTPAVDILDIGDAFLLTAELPGVDEGDVDLKVTGDSLVLRGERNPDPGEKILRYHRVERHEGLFQRVFRLPAEVDSDRVRTSFSNGVLKIELPKRA